MFFKELRRAGDMTAGADPGDQRVDRRVLEVGEDFGAGGADMDVNIGFVLELLRHPCAGGGFDQLDRTLDRPLHALFARGQVKGRAVSEHQPAALDRHAFGHDEDELVPLDRGGHRQADAGVPRRRLDDGAAGLKAAVTLGCLDHGEADAILDRTAGIAAFRFYPDFGVGEQLAHADVRRVADGIEDRIGFHDRCALSLNSNRGSRRTRFGQSPARSQRASSAKAGVGAGCNEASRYLSIRPVPDPRVGTDMAKGPGVDETRVPVPRQAPDMRGLGIGIVIAGDDDHRRLRRQGGRIG